MLTNLSVWHKLLLLVSIPVLFQFLFFFSLSSLLQYAESQTDRYERSKEILLHFHTAATTMMREITNVVRDAKDAKRYSADLERGLDQMTRSVTEIQSAAAVRPELKESLEKVPELFGQLIKIARQAQNAWDGQNFEAGWFTRLRNAAFPLLIEYEDVEKEVLNSESKMQALAPQEMARNNMIVAAALIAATIISLAISVFTAYVFFKDILSRLRIIENNAHLMAMRGELTKAPSGRDEIAQLGRDLEKAASVLNETRRKELAVLDVTTDVMASIDNRYRFTAIGAGASQAWGFVPDQLLGESLFSIITDEPAARTTLERIAQASGEGEFESGLKCQSGEVKDVLWRINWSKETNSFYCIAHDISERRAAERMKQRFIAIVSHDLRTPLSSVSAALSLLNKGARGTLTPQTKGILGKAEENLERLMDLIRDLLDLEKLEAGKVVMELACVSSLDVCNAACDSVEFLAKSLNVKIVRFHSDTSLLGDERRLVRVIINLISNAIKFSPSGGSVTLKLQDFGSYSEISVIDQGPGIAEADRELIFEKFRQSGPKSASPIKGTGLGLAIAKIIAEGHGGKLGVESQEGKGSRFFLQIPNFQTEDLAP